MPAGHVFIATSLDGHIARADGSIDWLEMASAAGEDHGYDGFIDGMDAMVMGRATWETVRGFDPWPYALPALVLSTTLADVPAGQGRIVRSVAAALAAARDEGWRNLYIDGGATITAFLAAGAIASLTISRLPILLGGGRPLFGGLPAESRWRHAETRAFPSGLVQSRYELAPGGA